MRMNDETLSSFTFEQTSIQDLITTVSKVEYWTDPIEISFDQIWREIDDGLWRRDWRPTTLARNNVLSLQLRRRIWAKGMERSGVSVVNCP